MATIDVKVRKNRDGQRPFPEAQREMIQDAADEAEQMAIAGTHALQAIWNQPGTGRRRRERRKTAWRADAIVVSWFGDGSLTNEQIRNVRKRMERVRDEFDSPVKFAVIQHQTGNRSYRCGPPGAEAYCSPGTPIKLCPSWFWGRPGTGPVTVSMRAEVIIHELVHKNGHVHHRQATDLVSAVQLAIDHPRSARRNPSNYTGFCSAYPIHR